MNQKEASGDGAWEVRRGVVWDEARERMGPVLAGPCRSS